VIGQGPSVMYLADFVNGTAFRPDNLGDSGIPVVRIAQLLNESALCDRAAEPLRPVWIGNGDLIFSWSATLAVRIWNRGPALLNQHLFRVDVHPGIERRWFAYVLEEAARRLEPLMHGSAMTHITHAMLKSVTVSVPPVDVQRLVADHLDDSAARIDSSIAARQRMIELMTERRVSSAAEFVERVRSQGRTVPLFALLQPRDVTGHPDLEVLSVYRDHGVIPKSSRTDNFNKTPIDRSRYQVVCPGDVVVNKMKAWQGSIGVSEFEGIVSPDYLVLQPLEEVDRAFLHHVLRSPQVRAEFHARSEGIRPAQWRLQWDQMRLVQIPLPETQAQAAAVSNLAREHSTSSKLILALEKQVDLLREHRRALVSAAISSELHVLEAA
jgi:type I restriction enzyme, S subunit